MDAAEIAYAGIARQAELIATGELSSRELVELCLERIERYDATLNAFRVVFHERARLEADQADARRGAGAERPLLGVPIAIKDDTDVAGELTCFGTDSAERPASADQEVVRRLRAAGAIVIGKTHVPELTLWPFTETITFGTTRNPGPAAHAWRLQRGVGRCRGGGARRRGARLRRTRLDPHPVELLRPVRHQAPAPSHLTRAPRGQALRLARARRLRADRPGRARCGPVPRRDRADPARAGQLPRCRGPRTGRAADRRLDQAGAAPADRLGGARLRGRHGRAAALARAHGHRVRPRLSAVARPAPAGALPARRARLGDGPGTRRAHGTAHSPDRPYGPAGGERGLQRALASEAALAARVGRVFEQHDVLLTPVTARPALRLGEYEGRGAPWTMGGGTRLVPFLGTWNATGQPAASVPAGFTRDGVPLGVQLVGRPEDEVTLLALAAQIEAERPWARRRPAEFA